MRCFRRRFGAAVAAVALTVLAPAYVNIEDFTVGGFSVFLTGEQSYSQTQLGLDTGHSVFGKRGWFLDVVGNPEHADLHLDVGDGEQKLTTTSDQLSYEMTLGLGVSGNELIDLSQETSILIDLYTDPPHVFADRWSLLVTDVNGAGAGNDGWIFRPDGIRFDIASFSGQIDWSRVRSLEFKENMDTPPNPTLYSATHIYTVPEPSIFTTGLFLLSLLWRRLRRQGLRA